MAECMCNVFDEKHDNLLLTSTLYYRSVVASLSQGGYKINGEET